MYTDSVTLDGIDLPDTPAFTSTRDAVRQIVRRIADAFAKESLTVALEASADRETPDNLIVFDGMRTAIMPLRYTPQTMWIGSVAHYVGHADGVAFISVQIAAAIRNVARRWRE